jgi:hypothetical protein
MTRPGPCEPHGLECGTFEGVECGLCALNEHCFANRCYTRQGVPPSGQHPALQRALYAREEGQRFTVRVDGVLELVDAALWTDGFDVEANVYLDCNGQRTLIRNIPIPADRIPAYSGDFSERWSLEIPIHPPLLVRRGETMDIMFRLPEGAFPARSGTSGVELRDVDPESHFVFGALNHIQPMLDWDYDVTAYVH